MRQRKIKSFNKVLKQMPDGIPYRAYKLSANKKQIELTPTCIKGMKKAYKQLLKQSKDI